MTKPINFLMALKIKFGCNFDGFGKGNRGNLASNSHQKSKFDWTHTGIIIDIDDDTFTTIEGNTNHEGSRNGIAVMKRTRNFRKSKLDVFSVAPFT